MDKKQTTKKQYYFFVISYSAFVGEEKKTFKTSVSTDGFLTMGEINKVARIHCEKKYPDAKYIDNAVVTTFFAKITKKEYLATLDNTVHDDTTINIK